MDLLLELIKSRNSLKSKSLREYKYEIEIRLKDVIKDEFLKVSKVNSTTETEEVLYSIKGCNVVTIRQIGSGFFIKEKICSKIVLRFNAEIVLSLEREYHE